MQENKENLNEEIKVQSEEVEETTQEEKIEEVIDENVTDINEQLQEKKLQDEIESLNEKYQRLQAEYANYIRRTNQEKETIGMFANEKILNDIIPVIDSMERALEACDDKQTSMYKGIDLVYKQLQGMLTKYLVEEIEAENTEFDPNLHLAVMQENVDGIEPNKVVDVLQKGYKLGSKVLRPSMVKVSC